jgi:hypothetical protein
MLTEIGHAGDIFILSRFFMEQPFILYLTFYLLQAVVIAG